MSRSTRDKKFGTHVIRRREATLGRLTPTAFLVLPILPRHTGLLIHLPHHHRDPFDRLMIVQAIAELMQIVSADEAFEAYFVTRLWQ